MLEGDICRRDPQDGGTGTFISLIRPKQQAVAGNKARLATRGGARGLRLRLA